jgi:hypothetical protein
MGLLLYADDIVILADSREELVTMMAKVHEFCAQWRLKLNMTKCEVVVFGETKAERTARQAASDPASRWPMGHSFLEEKDWYKYIGIYISYDLKWDKHHKVVNSKVWTRVNDARTLGVRRGGLAPATAAHVWNIYGVPVMLYGISIWGTNTIIDALDVTQKQVLASLIGCPGRHGNQLIIRRDLGLESIATLHLKQCARLLQRITSHAYQHTLAARFVGEASAHHAATLPHLRRIYDRLQAAGLHPHHSEPSHQI